MNCNEDLRYLFEHYMVDETTYINATNVLWVDNILKKYKNTCPSKWNASYLVAIARFSILKKEAYKLLYEYQQYYNDE